MKYLSAPNPPRVILKIRAVDQRYPTVQLQGKFFINFRLPRHIMSSFTVQFVLQWKYWNVSTIMIHNNDTYIKSLYQPKIRIGSKSKKRLIDKIDDYDIALNVLLSCIENMWKDKRNLQSSQCLLEHQIWVPLNYNETNYIDIRKKLISKMKNNFLKHYKWLEKIFQVKHSWNLTSFKSVLNKNIKNHLYSYEDRRKQVLAI